MPIADLFAFDLPFAPADTPATPVDAIAAADWERARAAAPESAQRLAATMEFRAQAGKVLVIPDATGAMDRVLFGLGDEPRSMLFGALARALPPGDYKLRDLPLATPAPAAALAWALGAYGFDRYKPAKRKRARLTLDEAIAAQVRPEAEAVWLARDLVNTPASDMGPEGLHAAAEAVAGECGAAFEAIVGQDLLSANYPLIHAVGRAAKEAPRLLKLSWTPPGGAQSPRLVLIGKGVAFDSGGLNIKTDSGMRLMKKDMGGAATALALGRLCMKSGLNARVDVFVPAVENAIGADAFRPGDVIRSRKGLTVEIDNTDAEGRLILADALAAASETESDLTLDFATLTGAARVALGPDITPFFTADEALAAALAEASAAADDPLWRMPLWDAYETLLDSPIADMKNSAEGGMAGAIVAALFLRKFVSAKAWAHFDMYAWSQKDRPGRPAGADAQSLRAAWGMLKTRFG